jgi:hypothetical protein
MEKHINPKQKRKVNPCKHCGSTEFITNLNSYDVYEIFGGKLGWQRSEIIDEKFRLFCRECGEELKNVDELEFS